MMKLSKTVFLVLTLALTAGCSSNFPWNSKVGMNPQLADYSYTNLFGTFGEYSRPNNPYITYMNPKPEQYHGVNDLVQRPFTYQVSSPFYNDPYRPDVYGYSQYQVDNSKATNLKDFKDSAPKKGPNFRRSSVNSGISLLKEDLKKWKDHAFGLPNMNMRRYQPKKSLNPSHDSSKRHIIQRIQLMEELIKAYEK